MSSKESRPDNLERTRRRQLTCAMRDQQRQQVRESLPAPLPALKALFDSLDDQLPTDGCDDTLRFTREFIRSNAMDEDHVVQWLKQNGGHCDCEVLNNVEEVVTDAVPGYNELRNAQGGAN